MNCIPDIKADPITVALMGVAFGQALSDRSNISPHQEEVNAEGLIAAAAMLDALIDSIDTEWSGVFSSEAADLGEWMAEHHNANKALPTMQECIKRAALNARIGASKKALELIADREDKLSVMATGSGFVMPSIDKVLDAFPLEDDDIADDVFAKIRECPDTEITPIAIDLRFPNEIPDSESRMAWFAVDLNNGDAPFPIGRSLAAFSKDTPLNDSMIEHLVNSSGDILHNLRSSVPLDTYTKNLYAIDSSAKEKSREAAREAAHSEIKQLINDHGGVALDGYGYKAVELKNSNPEM